MSEITSDRVGPMQNPLHLGELIHESIADVGWSMTETTGHLGCERGTLSRLLKGKAGAAAINWTRFKSNRRLPSGCRMHKHHRWFTREYGYSKLCEHIADIMVLMRAALSRDVFSRSMDRVYPKVSKTISLT